MADVWAYGPVPIIRENPGTGALELVKDATAGEVYADRGKTDRITSGLAQGGVPSTTVDGNADGYLTFTLDRRGPVFVDFGDGVMPVESAEAEADTNLFAESDGGAGGGSGGTGVGPGTISELELANDAVSEGKLAPSVRTAIATATNPTVVRSTVAAFLQPGPLTTLTPSADGTTLQIGVSPVPGPPGPRGVAADRGPRLGISHVGGESPSIPDLGRTDVQRIVRDCFHIQNNYVIGVNTTVADDLTHTSSTPFTSYKDLALLDAWYEKMLSSRRTGGELMLTIYSAPFFMLTNANGSTPTTASGIYAALSSLRVATAYEARFAEWCAFLVDRYKAVRHWNIWNEGKGYYNNALNRWAYEDFTRMWKSCYTAMKAERDDVLIGGPYLPMVSYGTNSGASPSASGRPSAASLAYGATPTTGGATIAGSGWRCDGRTLDWGYYFEANTRDTPPDFIAVDGGIFDIRDATNGTITPGPNAADSVKRIDDRNKPALVGAWLQSLWPNTPRWWVESYFMDGSPANFREFAAQAKAGGFATFITWNQRTRDGIAWDTATPRALTSIGTEYRDYAYGVDGLPLPGGVSNDSIDTPQIKAGAVTPDRLAPAVSSSISSASAAAASSLAAVQDQVAYIATADATDAQKAAANGRVLPASGAAGLASALKGYLEGNRQVKLLGPASPLLVLDAQLVALAPDNADWDFSGATLRVHAGENNGGNSGLAGVILGGAAPSAVTVTGLSTTLGQGLDTFAHTTSSLPTTFPVGSWGFITSTEVRNPNRPLEYFKGEIFQVQAVSATSITFATATRDSYTTSSATIRKAGMCEGLRIRGLRIESNPAGTSRQNGLVLRTVVNMDVEVDVEGTEFADGVAAWGCVGGRLKVRSKRCQDRYGPGVQGYGVRIAGSEGVEVDCEDELSRHGFDAGMSSSQWPVTRHTKILRAHARHCYAAGFAVHDAEFTHTAPGAILALNCGGGIIVRGSNTRLDRPVVIGGHAKTYPWGPGGVAGGTGTQSTGAGITIGERTKLNLSTFDDTSASGLGGLGLEIIEPVIDLRGASGDFDGIDVQDPLTNATILVRQPIRVRRVGWRFSGDTITDSVIDIVVDHAATYSPPSGTTYSGVTLTGSTGTFDVGSGNTPPSVGTELISTGSSSAPATAAGWGGFVPGATYYVYSVSGTTFKVAARSSGNTAAITFGSVSLTGLSFVVGKRVHSAYVVPSVASTTQQYIRRSRIAITSTGCRDVPVVIGGARNGGSSYANFLRVAVTSLGSGLTAASPIIRWAGTNVGEWTVEPVDARVSNRAAVDGSSTSYTGLTPSTGGPTLTYAPGRSVFADGAVDLYA